MLGLENGAAVAMCVVRSAGAYRNIVGTVAWSSRTVAADVNGTPACAITGAWPLQARLLAAKRVRPVGAKHVAGRLAHDAQVDPAGAEARADVARHCHLPRLRAPQAAEVDVRPRASVANELKRDSRRNILGCTYREHGVPSKLGAWPSARQIARREAAEFQSRRRGDDPT